MDSTLGREIEPACELLHEVGICDFEPEQLVAMRDSRVFEAGRDALGYYHERRDETRNVGLGPQHDWSSNAADAFGYMAISYEEP